MFRPITWSSSGHSCPKTKITNCKFRCFDQLHGHPQATHALKPKLQIANFVVSTNYVVILRPLMP